MLRCARPPLETACPQKLPQGVTDVTNPKHRRAQEGVTWVANSSWHRMLRSWSRTQFDADRERRALMPSNGLHSWQATKWLKLRSVNSTAALSDNSLRRAGDATAVSKRIAFEPSVGRPRRVGNMNHEAKYGRLMKRGFRALPADLACHLIKLSRSSGFCNKCHRQAGHLRDSCFRLVCTIERQSLIFQ